jgi:hypothetical protein
MSEPKIDEKKVVGRNVAIALGIVCIVLTAALFVFYVENTNLQDQVNNLNAIINREKIVSEVLLNNKTYSLSPNENVSEWFYTPHSGDLKVECNMEPKNLDVWVNASWSVYFSPTGLYQVYPVPFIGNSNGNYIEAEFPVVSFGRYSVPNIGVTIGNNSPDTTTTVNVTITLYY